MSLRKLQKQADGAWLCPVCGHRMKVVEGGAVALVNGKLDMENYKPRYECETCGVFYREVMSTGYYDVFPLEKAPKEEPETKKEAKAAPPITRTHDTRTVSVPVPLPKESDGSRRCPKCHRPFRFVDGGPVRIVDGKVDMENTKPKYECDSCGVFYREIMTSGYYLAYPQTDEDRVDAKPVEPKQKPKKIIKTGDIPPTLLKRDKNNQAKCPRCGEMMDYMEGGAVRLVDGVPDMDNIYDRFICSECSSVYRRIAGTDYYQWSEK
ncbi:MAG: hypothetical protein ACI4OA_04065 [Selenomonadaceae bacterium]